MSGKSIDSTPPELIHFAVNKPKGYICSSVEAGGAGGRTQGAGKRAIDILEPWIAAWKVKNKSAVSHQRGQYRLLWIRLMG